MATIRQGLREAGRRVKGAGRALTGADLQQVKNATGTAVSEVADVAPTPYQDKVKDAYGKVKGGLREAGRRVSGAANALIDVDKNPDGNQFRRAADALRGRAQPAADTPQVFRSGRTPPPPTPPSGDMPNVFRSGRRPHFNVPPAGGGAVPPAGGGTPPTPPPAAASGAQPAPSRFPRMGKGAAVRALPYVAAAGELIDPDSRGAVNPASDMSGRDRLRQASRVALRTGGGILGGVAGSAVGPLGTIGGGTAGYMLGDKVADYLVGPQERGAGLRQLANLATGGEEESQVDSGTVGGETSIDVVGGNRARTDTERDIPTDQGLQTPQELISGTAVPESGYGAFQRTDVPSPARGLRFPRDAGSHVPQAPGAGRGADLSRLRSIAQQGPFGAMAALGAYGAASRMAQNQATNDINREHLGIKREGLDVQRATALASLRSAETAAARDARDFAASQRKEGEGRVEKEIDQMALELTPQQQSRSLLRGRRGENDKAYEDRLARTKADLAGDMRYSIANRHPGKELGDLSPTHRQQLFMGKKFKDRVEAARDTREQWVRDFTGTKQFDTRDLYSYLPKMDKDGNPVGIEKTALGGYKIRMGNGNTMSVQPAAGGGFNFTGPNDPVDADVMAIIEPHIRAYENKRRGK